MRFSLLKKKFNKLVRRHVREELQSGVITPPAAQQMLAVYEMRLEALEVNFIAHKTTLEAEIAALKQQLHDKQ